VFLCVITDGLDDGVESCGANQLFSDSFKNLTRLLQLMANGLWQMKIWKWLRPLHSAIYI